MVYKTQGTCSREIHFDVENNKLKNVSFVGGCNGNLKGIGLLVEGMDIDEVIKKRLICPLCHFCPDTWRSAVFILSGSIMNVGVC